MRTARLKTVSKPRRHWLADSEVNGNYESAARVVRTLPDCHGCQEKLNCHHIVRYQWQINMFQLLTRKRFVTLLFKIARVQRCLICWCCRKYHHMNTVTIVITLVFRRVDAWAETNAQTSNTRRSIRRHNVWSCSSCFLSLSCAYCFDYSDYSSYY